MTPLTLRSRPNVEQIINDFILPIPSSSTSKDKSKDKTSDTEVDETRWTDRLLTVMNYLEEEKAINALMVATNLKSVNSHPTPYQRFVDACIANNVSLTLLTIMVL